MRFKGIVLLLFGILIGASLTGQNSKLADQYYLDGEYEKAGDIYQQLYKKSNRSDFYFNKYVECLLALTEYQQAEKTIEAQIAAKPKSVNLFVTLGNVLERQNKFDEADQRYLEAIQKLPADVGQITKLGNAFLALTKYDEAIRVYEKGNKLLKKQGLFSSNLADLYRRKGDVPKMVEQYLYSLNANPKRLPSTQQLLQRYLQRDDYDEVKSQLYGLIQDYPEAEHFPEMLAWVFIQQKDYKSALRQLRAIDKRKEENGHRVWRLGRIAANARQYDVAIQAFDYIVDTKGPNSTYYLEAKRASLVNKRKKIVENYDYTQEDLATLKAEYNGFLNDIGRNKLTAKIIAELADLEAFYINDLDEAIALLDEVVKYPGVDKVVRAKAKISLADFYLMKGEIWEATLLYSQVDKAFKEELLGQEARFRNAKLSYYNGDFEWAQDQFDILKASTSRLIANDALDLSIFIMDNLGLDTTDHPMRLYAEADLLTFQNKFEEAFQKLTLLRNLYEEHGLLDDILYLKAQIHMKKREYQEAGALFEEVISSYPEEIRADNSLFALAELYENQLNDPEKAKELYEKLFIEYSGSTFSVEARKRYRILRGDFDPDEMVN